jgi:hypothetical protein
MVGWCAKKSVLSQRDFQNLPLECAIILSCHQDMGLFSVLPLYFVTQECILFIVDLKTR